MQEEENGGFLFSPSDIISEAACSFAFLRRADQILGHLKDLPIQPDDPMNERIRILGAKHEQDTLKELSGNAVNSTVRIPVSYTPDDINHATRRTLSAVTNNADLIYQATGHDDHFHGRADFLVRQMDGRYLIADTKLARHVTMSAVLQLGAYWTIFASLGVPLVDHVSVLLGNDQQVNVPVADVIPVVRHRMNRIQSLIRDRQADNRPIAWDVVEGCCVCVICQEELKNRDDLLTVAGMRKTQRRTLLDAGITSKKALAQYSISKKPIAHMAQTTAAKLSDQAREQIRAEKQGHVTYTPIDGASALATLPPPDPGDLFFDFEGDPLYGEDNHPQCGLDYLFGMVDRQETFQWYWADSLAEEKKAFTDFMEMVINRRRLYPNMHIYHYAAYEKTHLLSLTQRHGIYGDEVDALVREHVLVDLYPIVTRSIRIGASSYSLKEVEKIYRNPSGDDGKVREGEVTTALASVTQYSDYCDFVTSGKQMDANHIKDEILSYNEVDCQSTLQLDDWLRQIARDQHVSSAPTIVHDGDSSDVDSAGTGSAGGGSTGNNSAGNNTAQTDAQVKRQETLDRRRYLEHALLGLADALPQSPAGSPPETAMAETCIGGKTDGKDDGESDGYNDHGGNTASGNDSDNNGHDGHDSDNNDGADDVQALRLAAAALGFYERENKSFWWEHYYRLDNDIHDWPETAGIFFIEHVEVIRDWHKEGRQSSYRRIVDMRGHATPGSLLSAGSKVFTVYDHVSNVPSALMGRGNYYPCNMGNVTVLDASPTVLRVEEALPGHVTAGDIPAHCSAPIALTPPEPPKTTSLEEAIDEWAHALHASVSQGTWPKDPAVDILRRHCPRLVNHRDPRPLLSREAASRRNENPMATQVQHAVQGLDCSYLAVQGPPGTGKTFTGARVVADLVDAGWKVGIVSQSHSGVENFLRAAHKAGIDTDRIGKKAKTSGHQETDQVKGQEHTFTKLSDTKHFQTFINGHPDGFLIGGTAWDFSNMRKVGRRQLDLLVIDEAGQFSLANTIACSVSAKDLLLLGDPQQLPQVTQGIHPQPVDASALGHLCRSEAVLPQRFGYFLSETWRMSPQLTKAISGLSYDNRLTSCAPERCLENTPPGIHSLPVEHRDRSVESPEEAQHVIHIVEQLTGTMWEDLSLEDLSREDTSRGDVSSEDASRDSTSREDAGREPDKNPDHRDQQEIRVKRAPQGAARPLVPNDIIIVSPFNAQVKLIENMLRETGFADVSVGTVDKFQGREAVCVIVSMASSDPASAPRGTNFILNRNRLNVAISRAQWASWIIYSPALLNALPTSLTGLNDLGAFTYLCDHRF